MLLVNKCQQMLLVQREGINQEIVKAREHVYDTNDDIIQASVNDIKTVQNNKLIIKNVAIQRRVTKVKIAKEIMIKRNSQMHQELQLTLWRQIAKKS